MKPSSFQTTIENQFDYICKCAMDDERKDYMKILSRQSKREISFSVWVITSSVSFQSYTVRLAHSFFDF